MDRDGGLFSIHDVSVFRECREQRLVGENIDAPGQAFGGAGNELDGVAAEQVRAVLSGIPDRLQNSSKVRTGESIWMAICAMIGPFGCGCWLLFAVVVNCLCLTLLVVRVNPYSGLIIANNCECGQ